MPTNRAGITEPPPAKKRPDYTRFADPAEIIQRHASIDRSKSHVLNNNDMDADVAAAKPKIDELLEAIGVTSPEAKHEVCARVARLYPAPKAAPSDAELMQDLPPSLQPRAYRQRYDAETVKTAQQVVNRVKNGKAKGETFDDDEQRRYRAACRIVGTARQKTASP